MTCRGWTAGKLTVFLRVEQRVKHIPRGRVELHDLLNRSKLEGIRLRSFLHARYSVCLAQSLFQRRDDRQLSEPKEPFFGFKRIPRKMIMVQTGGGGVVR